MKKKVIPIWIGEKPEIVPESYTPDEYLYICDPEAEIKEGEWVWRTYDNDIYRITGASGLFNTRKRIVASNDPKLQAEGIPGISEQFIKEYVAAGEGCEIEMEIEYYNHKYASIKGLNSKIDRNRLIANGELPCLSADIRPKKDSENNLVLSVVKKEINLSEIAEKLKDRVLFPESLERANKLVEGLVIPPYEQVIQKQIEDAAEKYGNSFGWHPHRSRDAETKGFIAGVNWARKNL